MDDYTGYETMPLAIRTLFDVMVANYNDQQYGIWQRSFTIF